MDPIKLESVYYILGSLAIVSVPLRWLWQWTRRVDKAVTNHIPHIYAILKRMCEHLQIEYIDLESDLEEKDDETRKTGHKG